MFCLACGREYPADADEPWRCACGSPLELSADAPGTIPTDPDPDRGLWAFADAVPVPRLVSLGEGWTPLVDAPEWAASFKLDYLFPTGSFKDRGATTTVSRAVDLGVERVVEDSSGNAGLAVATYAARAGIDAEIYVPADAKAGKVRAIERTGADLVHIEGTREDVAVACREAAEDAWYASHAWNPAFYAGTATVAYEIAAQRGWNAPDAVVTPLGHGTLFLGAYRGFRRLHEAGLIDSMPRLLAAQAAGRAPVVERLGNDPGAGENDRADGIRIDHPVREDEIVAAIEETDGDAIAVDAASTDADHDALARAGFHVEPTSAVAPAALGTYRERGVVEPDEDVVVVLTGSGLK